MISVDIYYMLSHQDGFIGEKVQMALEKMKERKDIKLICHQDDEKKWLEIMLKSKEVSITCQKIGEYDGN